MGCITIKDREVSMEYGYVPTWKDFPAFYNNPTIQKIAKNEKWTASTTQEIDAKHPAKMPLDMRALIDRGEIWGCKFDRGYNPLIDLPTLCNVLPTATNNAYYLNAMADKIVVLDIEPYCDDIIKQELLKLPYLYGETSMSGKGYHLIFNLPEDIWIKYPNARKQALKEDSGMYEILLEHMVTFTRNALPPSPTYGTRDIKDFEALFEFLCTQAKPTNSNIQTIIVDESDMEEIPYFDEILDQLLTETYGKTLTDFPQKNKSGYDNSGYEFGMSRFYYVKLMSILDENGAYKGYTYSQEEKAVMIYKCLIENLEYRPKHDTVRYNMPWLLFVASNLIAKFSWEIPTI